MVAVKVFLYLIGDKVFDEINTVTNNYTVHAVTAKPDKAAKDYTMDRKKEIKNVPMEL